MNKTKKAFSLYGCKIRAVTFQIWGRQLIVIHDIRSLYLLLSSFLSLRKLCVSMNLSLEAWKLPVGCTGTVRWLRVSCLMTAFIIVNQKIIKDSTTSRDNRFPCNTLLFVLTWLRNWETISILLYIAWITVYTKRTTLTEKIENQYNPVTGGSRLMRLLGPGKIRISQNSHKARTQRGIFS